MKRHLLLAECLNTPWALIPERLATYSSVLHRWSAGMAAPDEVMAGIEADKSARASKRAANVAAGSGGIAVLPLYGVVTQRGNMMDDLSGPGSCSTQNFADALNAALADDTVGQILIDIDSPGGSVYGVAELGAQILAARAQKPVIAVANSLAASAAYWIGSQAGEFYITPGGEVGSIGVYMMHQDVSAMMEAEGVKTTFIKAGEFKTEGNPYQPMDDAAQAYLQTRVDDYYGAFTKAVSKGRSVGIDQVRNGMGQGRVLGANDALAQNMVDGIATFDEVITKMQKQAKSAQRTGASRVARANREIDILG
jgi:signal peptide peptidase SppA